MDMILLSLAWSGAGILFGLLVTAARLPFIISIRWRWFHLAGIGALGAQTGGWSGIVLLGRFFATGAALGVTMAGLVILPWIYSVSVSSFQYPHAGHKRTSTPASLQEKNIQKEP